MNLVVAKDWEQRRVWEGFYQSVVHFVHDLDVALGCSFPDAMVHNISSEDDPVKGL